MSYILEALKKAEAERLTGAQQAAQMVSGFSASHHASAATRQKWRWAAMPATALVVIAAVWFGIRDKTPAPIPASPDAVASPPQAKAQVTPSEPAAHTPQAAQEAAPKTPPAATIARHDNTTDNPDNSAVKVPAKPTDRPAGTTKDKPARKPVEKKRPPETVDAKTAKAAARPPEPPVPTLRELPEQVQREIPSFRIGGYIYSGNRADRSVLVNNRLLREGEEIAPGLLLEQMMPNGMVLSYRGHRFRAGY